MLNVLERMNFKTPTPVQHQAIPLALEGKDIVGIAQTGTGKTMAFGIPTIQRIAADGGQALVLVPTRELALQVAEALDPVLQSFQLNRVVLIGGVKQTMQVSVLKQNPSMIIATPGRLLDLLYQGILGLEKISVLILDEADRMFDMGFAPQINDVIKCLTGPRQTLLFSATMPAEIAKLATAIMRQPISVEIAPTGTTTEGITQELFIVKETVKPKVLRLLLKQHRGPVLVFTRTKIKAGKVTKTIKQMGEKVAEIHSDRSMGQRNQAIEGFKRGRYRVLVATDIASRGIDVDKIELVINYDIPDEGESYIHRIGRTGRAGETGLAVSLATPAQSKEVGQIEALIKKTLPRREHPELTESFDSKPAKQRGSSRGKRKPGSADRKRSPSRRRRR